MKNAFTQNIILLLGINVLIKPLYVLGIDAQVQNQVGDQAYGLYFSLFNFCFLFQIILDMGILNFNSKEVAQNRAGIKAHFAAVFGSKLILALVFVLALLLGAIIVGYPHDYYQLIFGLASIMTLQSLYVYLRSHFSALGHYRMDSYLSALDKLLMIFILGYFIYVTKQIDITRFIWGQILALGLSIIIVLLLLRRKFELSLQLSLSKTKALLQKSFPFALVFVLMALYTRLDGVMLERMLDDKAESAGIYAKAYRLLDAANVLGYLFSMLLLPMFAHKLGEKKAVSPLVNRASGMLLTLVTIISLISWFYATEIMTTIYTNINPDAIAVFRILMTSFWFMSLSYIFGALILAEGQLASLNYLFLLGILINVVLNYLFIPKTAAIGAAQATLITQSFVFLGQFLMAKNRFKLTYPSSYIFKTVIFMIFSYVILYIFSEKLTILWFLEAFLAAISLLGVSILIGLFRFNLTNEI